MKCKYDVKKHDDFQFMILSNNGRAFFLIVTFLSFFTLKRPPTVLNKTVYILHGIILLDAIVY